MLRLVLASLMLFIVGCGFHLRGHVVFPEDIRAIHLHEDIPDPFFVQNLHQQIAKLGIQLTDETNVPTLNILEYGITEEVLAYSANAEPERIRFKLSISYELLDVNQELLIRNSISKARDLTVPASEQTVYSNVNERYLNEAELQKEAIVELMRQVGATLKEQQMNAKE